jgi:hypothetical protein
VDPQQAVMRSRSRENCIRFPQASIGALVTGKESRHRAGADGNVPTDPHIAESEDRFLRKGFEGRCEYYFEPIDCIWKKPTIKSLSMAQELAIAGIDNKRLY